MGTVGSGWFSDNGCEGVNVPAIATHSLRLAVDAAHFVVRGSVPEDIFDDVLLARATKAPPSHCDTVSMLVMSPHQKNFDTAIGVEVWDQRPDDDREEWQQVSEGYLTVDGHGELRIESPTVDLATCPVQSGQYVIEVSGRGFITYGWPGSTHPGDVWRLRLWPDDGTPLRAPKLWGRPDAEIADLADMMSEPLRYGAIITSKGNSGLDGQVTRPDFTVSEIANNAIIAAVQNFPGSVYVYAADPGLVAAICNRDESTQRQIAVWAAGQACAHTNIMDRPWVRNAIAAAASGQPVDLDNHYERLREERDPAQPEFPGPGLALFSYPTLHRAMTKPFDYRDPHPRHHAAFAVAAVAAAGLKPPLRAAVDAVHQACLAVGDKDTDLRDQLRDLLVHR